MSLPTMSRTAYICVASDSIAHFSNCYGRFTLTRREVERNLADAKDSLENDSQHMPESVARAYADYITALKQAMEAYNC